MAVDMTKPGWNLNQTRYVSPIFQADWDSAVIDKAWDAYIRDHYVHDLDLSDLSPRCSAMSPAFAAMLHPGALRVDTVGRKIVAVDWTYTPAQAAEARTAEAGEAAHTAAQQAPTAAANQNYAWCNSAWAGVAGTMMPAGTVMYFSDVFVATPPPPPSGATVGNGWAQRNASAALQAPFLAFLQKKYGYNNGGNYPVDCRPGYAPTVAGLQSAQKAKQQFEDLARQNKGQIVETGWSGH